MKPFLRYLLPVVLLITAFGAGYLVRGQAEHKKGHRLHGSMGPRFVKKLERKLNLSEEQSKLVREILVKRHSEAMRIKRETRPRFKELQKGARKEIFAILDEGQKDKFKLMIERHKERRKKWRKSDSSAFSRGIPSS